jgi:uncharacterized protein HemX
MAMILVALLLAAGAYGAYEFQQEAQSRKLLSAATSKASAAEVTSDEDLAKIKAMSKKVYQSCIAEANQPSRSSAEKESILSGMCAGLRKKYQALYGEEP